MTAAINLEAAPSPCMSDVSVKKERRVLADENRQRIVTETDQEIFVADDDSYVEP